VSPPPPQIEKLRRTGLVLGGIGVALCVVGWATVPVQFFRSYLVAYLFFVGLSIGCMSIIMIHHLSGGMWGLLIRRILEAGTRTLFFFWILFLPLFLGLKDIYLWAAPRALGDDEGLRRLLEHKSLYLNAGFFVLRAVFYFAAWAGLAYFLNKWSLDLDQGQNLKISRRLRGLSGGGLLIMGLTITFASVDWAMSVDPRWFSTIYGILFMVGQALSAMALAIVVLAILGRTSPFAEVTSPDSLHDLGKLLFAFTMLWAYVSLSQFLIMWSGNLPDEITWYLRRLGGGWQWLALAIVLLHFVIPFMLLLSRGFKRNPVLLGAVAAWMLLARFLDLFWMIVPSFEETGLRLHWLDVAAPLGVGGMWLAVFAWQLKGRPLVPLGEPEISERLLALKASE